MRWTELRCDRSYGEAGVRPGWQAIKAATAASHTKGTYLQAQYERLRARRGHARAITALAHSTLVAAWHILTPARSTATREATTSSSVTPNERPDGSSRTSKSSDTSSRSNRQ